MCGRSSKLRPGHWSVFHANAIWTSRSVTMDWPLAYFRPFSTSFAKMGGLCGMVLHWLRQQRFISNSFQLLFTGRFQSPLVWILSNNAVIRFGTWEQRVCSLRFLVVKSFRKGSEERLQQFYNFLGDIRVFPFYNVVEFIEFDDFICDVYGIK